MCVFLRTHYLSQLDSFYLSLQAQSLLPLLPQPELAQFFSSSLLCLRSLFCDHISVYPSPCGRTPLYTEALVSNLLPTLCLHENLPLSWHCCISSFSRGCQFPDWREGDPSMASSTAPLGYGRGAVYQRPIPLSLCVNVSCAKWVITTLSFEYFSWPKFSYFWNSHVAIPSS